MSLFPTVPFGTPSLVGLTASGTPSSYLEADDVVDAEDPAIRSLAFKVGLGRLTGDALIDAAFRQVRDRTPHSWDIQSRTVTVSASECLHEGTGICYAKSHLLAALLRACGVPTGFCYQRVVLGASRTTRLRHVIHALNAVWLGPHRGWLRIDARGNKAGVDARFAPPSEFLAFAVAEAGERDYLAILPKPHPAIVGTLRSNRDAIEMYLHRLPDALEGVPFIEALAKAASVDG